MTETPVYDQVVSEYEFDPLDGDTEETPSTQVGGQLASGASPGQPGASPAFPAEDVDAAPAAAEGAGAADSRDDQ